MYNIYCLFQLFTSSTFESNLFSSISIPSFQHICLINSSASMLSYFNNSAWYFQIAKSILSSYWPITFLLQILNTKLIRSVLVLNSYRPLYFCQALSAQKFWLSIFITGNVCVSIRLPFSLKAAIKMP